MLLTEILALITSLMGVAAVLKIILRKACVNSSRRLSVLALLPLAVLALHGAAADWPKEYVNPNPAKDDVVLPLPCGGAMAFRKVLIPNQGPLNDYGIVVGGNEDGVDYAEHARPAQVAGSFDQGASERYYLIGKYEVSRAQYEAFEPQCAKPTDEKRLPQTKVTWFEALAYADRYNQWLLKNAADQLPKVDQQSGFLRLPTEVEWEFAARGGLAIPVAQFQERLFPMDDDLVRYVWFDGSESANGKPQAIGTLKPNPLGLHDVLGNVDEIVLDPYRLNRLDRLHGQAGGFIVRGGNFFTPREEIRSAQRIEVPFYVKQEPRRAETTGFRLVVVAPVESSRDRLKLIREAWQKLGTAAAAEPKPDAKPAVAEQGLDNPVDELGALADATPDVNMKGRLKNVQNRLKVALLERDDQRRLAGKAALRLGAFLCQKMAADGQWVDASAAILKRREQEFGAEDARTKAYRDQLQRDQAALRDNLLYYSETILGAASIYDDAVLASQFGVLKTELELKGYKDLIRYAESYYKQLMEYRKQPAVRQSQWLSRCQAIKK